jgi:hypothetical protein
MGEGKKFSEAFRKNGDETVVCACRSNADTTLLEHTVVSDGKKNQDRDREHRDNRVTEHPVQARFEDIAHGVI